MTNQTLHPALNIEHLLDTRPMTALQILLVILCGATMFIDGFGIQVMALSVPSVSAEWGLPATRFGMALSASLIGLTVGAALLAPLGDRFGRRPALISALVAVGLSTAGTALSSSPEQFVFWRLLTGLGLGVSIPICNTWAAEYIPLRQRGIVLVLINAAMGVGAFSAGFIAPPVIEAWSWRGIFVLAGVTPVLVAVLLWRWAPESLKFLNARYPGDPRVAAILARIAPDIDLRQVELVIPAPLRVARVSVAALLAPAYRSRTLVLWGLLILNLFSLYLLISWLPTLLQSAGWLPAAALRAAVLIQAGGVIGGIALGLLLDRGKTLPALFVAFLTAALCLALFALVPSGSGWIVLLLMIGGGITGAQLSLNALCTSYYPAAIKATGMSWAGVVGSCGSISAPLAGAWIIGQGLAPASILALLGIPALLCAVGVLLMRSHWQAH
ncbi:MFS transporter [Pseudomonas kilonensis]|uniref:MFS transporter, AAHS family, 4-hydroxybenzoate transporter n=1 Tax=Pseudomonas kilonensis TaxID=132476 RepID=A0ABY0ZHI6_9PSED|nr:MFS transporter [Pseudomonas kilonensis]SEE68957.1 MFS transporter, AAHS family, 4-hydroxybenzoate transporter [Pseudomonas kilonensis]